MDALEQVARAIQEGVSRPGGRLPSLRKGARVAISSHTPWFGKLYNLKGVVEVTPRTVRSGAVMLRVKVEEGGVSGKYGTRPMVGKSVWVPWSPSYVEARVLG